MYIFCVFFKGIRQHLFKTLTKYLFLWYVGLGSQICQINRNIWPVTIPLKKRRKRWSQFFLKSLICLTHKGAICMSAIWFESRIDIDYTLDYNFIAIKFMVLRNLWEISTCRAACKASSFLQKIHSVNKIFGLIFELFF